MEKMVTHFFHGGSSYKHLALVSPSSLTEIPGLVNAVHSQDLLTYVGTL